ncbi:MAG TPA: hypothetical protein PLI45_00720 [Candidatus Woesebacteria bacterium]|nr:hypothetical protein [Candidatus Woesebacteria bacterium]
MIKVNLISKKRRSLKGENWTRLIVNILFGLFSAYFLGITLYVVISMLVLNNKIKNTQNEAQEISSMMLKNNEKLSRFVLTKLILTQIESSNKGRFKYKEYLDGASALLPVNASISGVDFSVKGWMSVAVTSKDVLLLRSLENVLINEGTWKDNRYFSSAYVESVTRDKSGVYYARLQLELKQINGTK